MTETAQKKTYDLAERTARFGEKVIEFCKKVPRNPITDPLKDDARLLWQEAKELNLIFNAIYKKVQ